MPWSWSGVGTGRPHRHLVQSWLMLLQAEGSRRACLCAECAFATVQAMQHEYEVRFAKDDPETRPTVEGQSQSHAKLPGSSGFPTPRASRCIGSAETRTPARHGPTWSGPGRAFGRSHSRPGLRRSGRTFPRARQRPRSAAMRQIEHVRCSCQTRRWISAGVTTTSRAKIDNDVDRGRRGRESIGAVLGDIRVSTKDPDAPGGYRPIHEWGLRKVFRDRRIPDRWLRRCGPSRTFDLIQALGGLVPGLDRSQPLRSQLDEWKDTLPTGWGDASLLMVQASPQVALWLSNVPEWVGAH